MYTHTHTRTHTNTFIYTHTHTHTHTHTNTLVNILKRSKRGEMLTRLLLGTICFSHTPTLSRTQFKAYNKKV